MHWVTIEGGHAAFEATPEAIYLVIGLRNAGSGIAVLRSHAMRRRRVDL